MKKLNILLIILLVSSCTKTTLNSDKLSSKAKTELSDKDKTSNLLLNENVETKLDTQKTEDPPEVIPSVEPTFNGSSSTVISSNSSSELVVDEKNNSTPIPEPISSLKPEVINSQYKFSDRYINRPIDDINNLTDSQIQGIGASLFFKDEAKIRWDEEKEEFFSLNSVDVTNINRIMKEYNIAITVITKYSEENEIRFGEEEIKAENILKFDVPNNLSTYYLRDLKEKYPLIINEFRKDKSVRLCNSSVSTGNTGGDVMTPIN